MLNDMFVPRTGLSVRWAFALAVLTLVSVSGCDGLVGSSESNAPSFTTPASYETLSSAAPKTEAIAQGQYGDLENGAELVIRNEEELSALWEQLHANRDSIPPQPEVNFDQETVVGVVMDSQPTGGYAVEINEAILTDQGDAMQVQYTEVVPGDNCNVTMAFTSPYVLASVDAPANEATFSASSETRTCGSSE